VRTLTAIGGELGRFVTGAGAEPADQHVISAIVGLARGT
jgi:hypothetical protein